MSDKKGLAGMFEQVSDVLDSAQDLATNLKDSPLTKRFVQGVADQLDKESLTNKPQPVYKERDANPATPKLPEGQWRCVYCNNVTDESKCPNCGAGKQ